MADAVAVLVGVVCFPVVLFTMLTGFGPVWWKNVCARFIRKIKKKKKPFEYTLIVPGVLLGALPRTEAHMTELVDKNTKAIVTLNMEWEVKDTPVAPEAMKIWEGKGVKHVHLPTPDYSAVAFSDLVAGVESMKEVIGSVEGSAKGVVYVHCNAGKGRSTSVVLCYLICVRGMSRVQAYNFVKEKRPKIAKFRALCDTRPQWRAVAHYERHLQNSKGGGSNGASNRVAPAPSEGS